MADQSIMDDEKLMSKLNILISELRGLASLPVVETLVEAGC